MDPSRFDALVRALAPGASRRGLLGAVLAAALAPLAAAGQGRGGPSAQGVCGGGVLDKCARDADCCNKRCDRAKGRCRCARSGEPCTRNRNCCDRAAAGPLTCQGDPGARTCKPKPCSEGCGPCETCQRGSCVPDPARAGDACGEDKVCNAEGGCVCDSGLTECAGACVDTGTDKANCGRCDNVCAAPEHATAPGCSAGACTFVCDRGWADCGGGAAPGCGTDTDTDAAHCGACGNACATGQVCRGGECGVACGGNFCPAATKVCDNGNCRACDVCATCDQTTVQAAVDAAATGGTVVVCAGTWPLDATVRVAKDLTLVGAGAGATVLDGKGEVRVLRVGPGATVTLRGLTVANGQAPAREIVDDEVVDDGNGGGIFTEGTLTLVGVGVAGNRTVGGQGGGSGGGIFNSGALTLGAGTRVAGNVGGNNGGGVVNFGTLVLQDGSRVTGNTAYVGGGIRNGGTATLRDGSLVTGNNASLGSGILSEGRVTRNATTTIEPRAAVCGNSGSPDCHNNLVTFSGTCPNLPDGTCPPA